MSMNYRHFITVGLLCIFSGTAWSGGEPSPTLSKEAQKEASSTWRERRLAYGKEVYEQACASCHDEGTDGTPAIGDREAWSDRSPLWSAVLFEHSKDGYLDMPARGTNQELTDQDVDAAGEYLLSVTFPELPLD
jgi:cytochrome c5